MFQLNGCQRMKKCMTCQHGYKRKDDDETVHCRKRNGKCEYKKYKSKRLKFVKKDYQTDEEINNNPYLSEAGKYACKFARNHGMSVSEAMSTPTVKAYSNYCNSDIFRSAT